VSRCADQASAETAGREVTIPVPAEKGRRRPGIWLDLGSVPYAHHSGSFNHSTARHDGLPVGNSSSCSGGVLVTTTVHVPGVYLPPRSGTGVGGKVSRTGERPSGMAPVRAGNPRQSRAAAAAETSRRHPPGPAFAARNGCARSRPGPPGRRSGRWRPTGSRYQTGQRSASGATMAAAHSAPWR
jgi:hypothetical protein